MQVKLRKIKSSHNNLRTDIIDGECYELPLVGREFVMTAPPLEFGNIRIIHTTPVLNVIQDNNKYFFKTANSEYELTVKE